MPIIVYRTVVVTTVSTEILPDRSSNNALLFARLYNDGSVPLFSRFGTPAEVDNTEPIVSGATAYIQPIYETENWMQRAYNGIVETGTIEVNVMEVLRDL